MYDVTTRPNIATVRRALQAVGETFPKPVLKALEEHDKILAAAREFTPASQGQIADAVAECLLADRDPATDEAVRRLVASHSLSQNGAAGYGIDLTPQATGRVVAALTEQVDTILATFAGPAEEAGKQLAEASRVLGDEDDPQIIMSQGVAAVEAWTRAQKAKTLLTTIDGAWVALANLTGFASPSCPPASRLADLSLEQFESVGRNASAWEIVRGGGEIDLADRDTIRERQARLEGEREQRQQREANGFRDEYRRLHGATSR